MTALGQGGSGSYEYEYWLYNGTGWTKFRDFSTTETGLWNTVAYVAGNLTVKVKVRSLGSPSETGEAETTMEYRLTPVAGDFDGDGKSDISVFRPANGCWFICRVPPARSGS